MKLRSMKVAIIDPANFTPYRNYSLCFALEKANCDVTLFTSEFIYDPSLDFSKIKGINYFFLRFASKFEKLCPSIRGTKFFQIIKGVEYCLDLIRLNRYLEKYDYKIANIEWAIIPKLDFYFIKFLKRKNIKTALTVHNLLSHPVYKGKNAWKNNMKRVYSEVDLLIPLTETTKGIFIDETGIKPNKVKAVYHGNFDIFRTGRFKRSDEARKALGIPRETDVLLFFGIIWHYKGLEYLLKALKIVARKNNSVRLLVVGKLFTSKERLYERREFRELKDYINVHAEFIPMVDVEKFFAASDVIVMPHVHNLHSGQHHLAYTFGKPVIATACGDSLEIVEEGKSGFLVPGQDERALAEAIVRFFNLEEHKRHEMGRYCQLKSNENSWDKVAHSLIRTYKEFYSI
jgi:glycosyltransferase involved in cell wall biosynthesis